MASSFRSILEGLANSGQGVELQKKIRDFVQSGAIDKRQANNFFSELLPIANKNEKPPEPLSPSELADLREKFANLDGSGGPDVITRGLRNNQITKEETDAFFKGLAEKREREGRGPARDTSNFNKGRISNPPKPFTPSSQSGSSTPASQPKSSAPSSQSGSNLNREGFTKLLENLQESKAELASRLGKTNTPAPKVTAPAPSPAAAPAPRVTGPAFKVVNTPVTNPDAPTNNVTKPTGAAAGPKPKNKKQAKISSDFDQIDNLDLTNEQKNDLKFSRAQADNNTFNRGDFKFLLDKLEGSKIRQNRDAQSQERQNIYSRGLADMFANF